MTWPPAPWKPRRSIGGPVPPDAVLFSTSGRNPTFMHRHKQKCTSPYKKMSYHTWMRCASPSPLYNTKRTTVPACDPRPIINPHFQFPPYTHHPSLHSFQRFERRRFPGLLSLLFWFRKGRKRRLARTTRRSGVCPMLHRVQHWMRTRPLFSPLLFPTSE